MKNQIRLLILEDMATDAELMVDAIKYHGLDFVFKVVENEQKFRRELKEFSPDLVLSDFSLPMFTGLEAIKLVKYYTPEIPVIIVTGSINEETAVLCMKLGAEDYVLKTNLTRLGVAVESVLEKKKMLLAKIETEKALSRASKIINRSPAVAFRWKNVEEYQTEFVTENVNKLFEYTAKEFMLENINYLDLIHKDDIQRVSAEVADNSTKKSVKSFVHKPYRIITKSGKIKWVKDLTNIVFNKNGEITHFEGLIIDISKEVKLEKETVRFGRIFEESLNEILIFSADTYKFIQFNKAAQLNLGYSEEELFEMTPLDIKPEFNRKSFEELVRPLVDGSRQQVDFETVHRRKNGSCYNAEIHLQLSTFKENKVFNAIILDITKRKEFERKLIESEKFLNSVVDNIPNMVFVKDAKYLKFIRYNKAASELTGIKEDEILGKTDYDFSPKEEADFFVENDRKTLKEKQLIDIVEEKLHTREKGKRILHTKKIPILDEDGHPKFLLGISEDITEQKIMQKAVEESEKKFRLMATNTLDLIWSIDCEMNYTFINDAVFDILGYQVDEFMKMNARLITASDSLPILESKLEEALSRGKKGEVFQLKFEIMRIRKDRKLIEVEITANPVYDDEKNLLGFHGRTTDITERKRRENEIKEKSEELLRFNKHMIGRENRMIILKEEVNDLYKKLGLVPKYDCIDNIEESLSKM